MSIYTPFSLGDQILGSEQDGEGAIPALGPLVGGNTARMIQTPHSARLGAGALCLRQHLKSTFRGQMVLCFRK